MASARPDIAKRVPTPSQPEVLGPLQDFGPPRFHSIYFACGAAKYATSTVNGITIGAAEQQAVVEGGASTNVTIDGIAAQALVNGFLRGPGAAGVTAINPAGFNPQPASGLAAFFVNTSFLGAIGPDSATDDFDSWYQRWTCNSNRANFGGASTACTAVPN